MFEVKTKQMKCTLYEYEYLKARQNYITYKMTSKGL